MYTTLGRVIYGVVASVVVAAQFVVPTLERQEQITMVTQIVSAPPPPVLAVTSTTQAPRYRHGDCSWVPPVARSVGWSDHEMDQLIHIILRESGCCPRSVGGDRVDKDCNVIRVATWTHRSDSGLLQINGVHWKQDHPQYVGRICKQMGICTQEPLLDPKTNLAAGRLLYNISGWAPWTVQPTKP